MITFKKLVINNLGPYQESSYYFDKAHVTFIKGNNKKSGVDSNGVGKSMIFDILTWTMWEKTVRGISKDDIIRAGCDNGSAKLFFTKNGVKYKIVRYRGQYANAVRLYSISDDGKPVDLTLKKIADTQSRINALLGTYEIFTSIAYLGQGDTNKFLSGEPADRVKIVMEFFGLGVWDAVRKLAHQQMQDHSHQVKEEVARLQEHHNFLDSFDKDKIEHDKSYSLKMIDQCQKQYDKNKLILQAIAVYEKYRTKIQHTIQELKAEEEHLSDNLILIEDAKKQLVDKASSRPSIEKAYAKAKKQSVAIANLKNQLDDIAEKMSDAEKKMSLVVATYNSWSKQLSSWIKLRKDGSCPTCGKDLNTPAEKQRIEKQISAMEGQLKAKLKSKLQLEQDLASLERSKKEVVEHIGEMGSEESPSYYKQLLSDMDRVKEQIEEMDEKASKAKSKSSIRIKALNVLIKEATKEVAQLNLSKEITGNLYNKKEELQCELDKLELDLIGHRAKAAECKNMLVQYRSAVSRSNELSAKIGEVQGVISSLQFIYDAIPTIKLSLVDKINGILESEINEELSNIGVGMRVELVTETDKKSGGKINKYLIFIVTENGTKRSWESYSGGEKQRVSLAIYSAFQNIAQHQFSETFNLLILDEITMWLDESGISSVTDLLRNKDKHNIHIITHSPLLLPSTDDRVVDITMGENEVSVINQ